MTDDQPGDGFQIIPHEVVKSGDLVKVKVMEVNLPRQRIALSMRLSDSAAEHPGVGGRAERQRTVKANAKDRDRAVTKPVNQPPATGGTMADAFAKARKS